MIRRAQTEIARRCLHLIYLLRLCGCCNNYKKGLTNLKVVANNLLFSWGYFVAALRLSVG